MKIFNFICSVVVIITVSLSILTLASNVVVRSADVYQFYFNDSRVVDKIYTSLSSSEVADGITGFFNSWAPEEFQVYEDTGYDLQGIFSEEDSHNMMAVKQVLDCSTAVLLVSLVLTAAIYIYFLRGEDKKRLRTCYKCSCGLTLAGLIAAVAALITVDGKAWISQRLGMLPLGDDSTLEVVLGGDFIFMATVFFIAVTMVIFGLTTYGAFRLTKQPRIFF